MTGQELINWIKDHKAEDIAVEVAYRDDGGCYYGTDKDIRPLIVGKDVKLNYIGQTGYDRIIL